MNVLVGDGAPAVTCSMPRNLMVEIAEAYYHVMARDTRREDLFVDDDDWRFFLKALSEASGQTGWHALAWVLMGNHYHLLVGTSKANFMEGIKWFQNTCSRRFGVRYGK